MFYTDLNALVRAGKKEKAIEYYAEVTGRSEEMAREYIEKIYEKVKEE